MLQLIRKLMKESNFEQAMKKVFSLLLILPASRLTRMCYHERPANRRTFIHEFRLCVDFLTGLLDFFELHWTFTLKLPSLIFCFQVGPKPVLTIPDDPRAIGSFDLNHFSVRIMSVDYQASGPGHAPPASPGPRLNFSEDSKVVLGDSAESAFAYVHHMTLYDLEARGMVRPFCMAYVCSDQGKLMENYAELSTFFSQAADSLKTGNRQAFSMELQRKLQELE